MTVWLYAIIRNEERLLPYFLRHYTPWVDRLILYDDNSTDGTREILRFNPKVTLRDWPGSPGIVDDEFTSFHNEQWKEARGHADWVCVVDADEFLYHPNMTALLRHYLETGVTGPQIMGYTMVSVRFPTTTGQIYDEVKTGFPDDVWNKQAIFRTGIHYNMGRHSINPQESRLISSPTAEIKLLHYRGLGVEYVRERHRRNWDRVPERCRVMNLGANTNPFYSGHHSVEWFTEMIGRKWPEVVP